MKPQNVIVSLIILTILAACVAPISGSESCWDDTFSDESGIELKYNLTVAEGDVTLAGGTDHNGESWTPANGAEISGVHHNIGTFTVAAGTTVYVAPYDSGTGLGGSLDIHADTINIQGNLNGVESGYPGGNGSGHYYYGGPGGANWYPERGTGDGGTHNEVDGAGQYPTEGETFKLSSGGGGGYGGEGGLGCSYWTRYGNGFAAGGDAFGTSDTHLLKIGAGGAGGGGGYELPYKWGGKGGVGGAGIILDAATITVSGVINVNAEDGEDGESGYKGCGGGGGGAGGSIVINAGALSGSGSLYAEGGDGGDSGDGSDSGGHAAGGAGGGAGGRIKIWYASSTFSGSYSVMNGSGGAHGTAGYGHGLDGYPGEAGTYYSISQSYSPCTPGYDYKPSGYLKSIAVTPASMESWSTFSANHTENAETTISYQILDASDDSTLCTITAGQAAAGYDISTCADATDSIRLYADLDTTNTSNTPVLHDWTVCWTKESVTPSTPFLIYGWVNDTDSDPVNDPDVTVTNMNTSEIYEVENITTSNYYQVSTSSDNVSVGNVLHFVATKETTTHIYYEVTVADMNRGGFVQNITIDKTPRPDLVVTLVNAYHYDTIGMPWFNLTNEIDVKVENTGDVNAGAFNVSLTIDDGYSGKQNVPVLNVGENVTLTFDGWVPIGDDCFNNCGYTDTCHNFTITGVADCDNAVDEKEEDNNATVISGLDGRTCYDGYMADEPLENVAHGILNGRLNFTTGNGTYDGLDSVGTTKATEYEITIPAGASVALAKLNVYYTWHEDTTCPQMEVRITNETDTYVVPLNTRYNDHKCTCPEALYKYPWGNYVYDVTDYISGSGTYIVTVERTGGSRFCIPAPGIVYVYADENAPTIEYWLNEGADVLIGGRRYDGGYLAWWECINNATFPASTVTDDVATVTLGVVTPWGDSVPDDILSFNEIELGRGVYHGNSEMVDETIDGMSMYIGTTNAQVGVNMTDVTAQYLNDSANMASQADDGDNTMPSNAFLVVQYGEEVGTYTIDGYIFKDGNPQPDPKVNITNLDNDKEWAASIDGNFYNLTLNVGEDVNASETLLIVACKNTSIYESNCNVTNITATIPGSDHNVNLTLDHYCLNYYPAYPFHTWEEVNWSGPATMEMMIDHYRDTSDVPSQTELSATGIGYNQGCNANLSYVDPRGMKYTLNQYLHAYNGLPYVANYGVGSYNDLEDVLHYMCKWHYLGPGAAPAYGDYSNWMAVRGIHTDVKPTFTQGSYSIYGFWINDPNPGGIGENTYKTVDQWSSTYHLNLTGVLEGDDYKGKYVAVCEPPEDDDVTVNLVSSPARFDDKAKETVQAAKKSQALLQSGTGTTGMKGLKAVNGIDAGMKLGAEIGDVVEEANKWIVQAAIDGAMEQLAPYDAKFAMVFADVVGTEPLLVKSDATGDYYLVPFVDSESTSDIQVVIIIDAEDGHFKEASWVEEPVKYLPVSVKEALELVDKPGATAELVYVSGSPYYPDWKVTFKEWVFFVSQDGTVSGESLTLKATLEKSVKVYSSIYKESDVRAARDVAEMAEQGLDKEVYNYPKDFVCIIKDSIDAEHKVCDELLDRGIINRTETEELHKQLEALRDLIDGMKNFDAVKVAHAQDEVTDAISQQFSECSEAMITILEKNVEVYGKIHDKLHKDFKYESKAAKEVAAMAQEWLDNLDYYYGKKYDMFMKVIYESVDLEHDVCADLKELNLIKWAESEELHEQLEYIHIYMVEMEDPSVPGVAHLQDDVTETMQTVIESPMVIDYGSGLSDWCESQSEPPYWCSSAGWIVDGDTVEPGYERGHPANAIVRDGEGQGWENRAKCAVADSDDYAYITLDMGETRDSGTIVLRCAIDVETGHFDGTTTVYGSVDNKNWNELGTFVIPEDGTLTDYTASFSDEQVRYVKAYLSIGEAGATWFVDAITW